MTSAGRACEVSLRAKVKESNYKREESENKHTCFVFSLLIHVYDGLFIPNNRTPGNNQTNTYDWAYEKTIFKGVVYIKIM